MSLPRSAVFGVEDYALDGDGGEGTSDSAAPSTSTPAETSTEASETVIPDARWADGPADPVTHGSFRPSGSGRSLPGTGMLLIAPPVISLGGGVFVDCEGCCYPRPCHAMIDLLNCPILCRCFFGTPPDLMCLVCMEQLPIEDVFDLECGHAFCSTCFAGHLNVKINDGEVQNMTCPGPPLP